MECLLIIAPGNQISTDFIHLRKAIRSEDTHVPLRLFIHLDQVPLNLLREQNGLALLSRTLLVHDCLGFSGPPPAWVPWKRK